ncbi:unnamed protein product [Peronospora farinosa]|uniref:Poly A polymerase head domain-containing protein n=1 Tax=Peronospora farinosa TaxID=134698 RepID=A0AAV0U8M7_9STRA|nr:unnamed protein product [Peronospora farinosa]CAI5733192.1 unnamed protein product [Peronospora farinosa]
MRSLLTRRVRFYRHLSHFPIVSRIASISSISSSNNGNVPLSTASTLSQNLVLTLTPAEDSLFSFLEYIQRLYAPKTQLRVAGGWVRDKLRGTESEDIDIALDNVMGAKFAQFITTFQRERKLPPSSVGVVKANSNKSKHLEVATVMIEGAVVDLVHLRAEEYTQESRVPDVKFATPADDASRRDLTINALFYNLHTKQVEDFTGRGVQDLKEGIIRTPRDPVQTFLDDPLRVLRALRFVCEFQFTLDPALERAVLEQREIVDAMRRKVSRERIGIEVRKMLSGKDPARAFSLLRKFDLLDLVFNDTAGKVGKEEEADKVEDDGFKYSPREWTESIQTRAFHYLNYLQHSRLALAQCEISNVESTAAIFAPLFLRKLPNVTLDGFTRVGPPLHNEFHGITEQEIIASSLEFLDRQKKIVAALDSTEIVEMLKVHVKWPKPAGKRVALIIEAIATYPEHESNGFASWHLSKEDHENCHHYEGTNMKHRVQQFMWMMQYHSVLAPAMTILVSDCSFNKPSGEEVDPKAQEVALKASLDLAHSYTKSDRKGDKASQCRRLDGKTVRTCLGPGSSRNIAQALRVLHVWEKAHPNASIEDELMFLDRLAPLLVTFI